MRHTLHLVYCIWYTQGRAPRGHPRGPAKSAPTRQAEERRGGEGLRLQTHRRRGAVRAGGGGVRAAAPKERGGGGGGSGLLVQVCGPGPPSARPGGRTPLAAVSQSLPFRPHGRARGHLRGSRPGPSWPFRSAPARLCRGGRAARKPPPPPPPPPPAEAAIGLAACGSEGPRVCSEGSLSLSLSLSLSPSLPPSLNLSLSPFSLPAPPQAARAGGCP